jgi:hypothetical protein
MEVLPAALGGHQSKFNVEHQTQFWDASTTELFEFRDRMQRQPSFRRVWKRGYDLTPKLADEIRRKVKGKIDDHVVIEVCGVQGIGKSRVVQALVLKIWGYLDANNIVFTYEGALLRAKNLPKRSYIVVDEQPLMYGAGKEREAQEILNLIETCRIDGVSVIVVSPVSREQIAVHYVLEVIQRRVKDNLSKVAIKSRDRHRYLGHFLVELPPETQDKFYIEEYLPKKREFVKQIKDRALKRINLEDRALEVMQDPMYKHARSKHDFVTISMSHFPSLTITEHETIVSFIFMRKRQKWQQSYKEPGKVGKAEQTKNRVLKYKQEHLGATQAQIAKALKLSERTIFTALKGFRH